MNKDAYAIIRHPYVTEKTMNMMEDPKQNKLEFIVYRTATKKEIKQAIEKLFEVKVDEVNTFIARDGKHAVVRLNKDYSAEDVGMRIGVF